MGKCIEIIIFNHDYISFNFVFVLFFPPIISIYILINLKFVLNNEVMNNILKHIFFFNNVSSPIELF